MLKTYHPHLACMMQECMEEQGDYVLRDEAFEMIDDLKEQLKQQKAYEGQWQSTIDGLMTMLKDERDTSDSLRQENDKLRDKSIGLPINRRHIEMKWRVKYWRWINEQAGEWYRTGLMTKESAEKVAESFRQSHEQVEVYYDDDGK